MALHGLGRNTAAVEANEWLIAAVASIVDRAGNEALTSARRPVDADADVAGRYFLYECPDIAHGFRLGEYAVELRRCNRAQRFLQWFTSGRELAPIHATKKAATLDQVTPRVAFRSSW